MKVLDLQCSHGHTFEGWFSSEQDFVTQCTSAMVQCPVCSDDSIVKKLSAPRLNLSSPRGEPIGVAEVPKAELPAPTTSNSQSGEKSLTQAATGLSLTEAWMALARHVVANTTDVGTQFAEEARKMHYGEAEERAIRGKTTPDEARALVEEGIEVLPFALPDALKEPLH
jgi:hypothetical protein